MRFNDIFTDIELTKGFHYDAHVIKVKNIETECSDLMDKLGYKKVY